MLKSVPTFSSFSVNDPEKAKQFYGDTLGLDVRETPEGLDLDLAGNQVFIYPKPNHQPATFTVLNFKVDNIDATVDELASKGIIFEQYNIPDMPQDDKGVARGRSAHMGPDIAWFKDPAGNILSIIQED